MKELILWMEKPEELLWFPFLLFDQIKSGKVKKALFLLKTLTEFDCQNVFSLSEPPWRSRETISLRQKLACKYCRKVFFPNPLVAGVH